MRQLLVISLCGLLLTACGSRLKVIDVIVGGEFDRELGKVEDVKGLYTRQDDQVYVVAYFKVPTKPAKIISKWHIDDKYVATYPMEVPANEANYAAFKSDFSVTDWMSGEYRVDIYADGDDQPQRSVSFTVNGAS